MHLKIKSKALKFLVIALACHSGLLSAALTPEQGKHKDRGIVLYNQYKNGEAELTVAAEAGDAEAQFFLGQQIKDRNQYMSAEASKWLTLAAEQGDLYAMLSLSRSGKYLCLNMEKCPNNKTPAQWLELAKSQALKGAKKNNAEAMYILYLAASDVEWLRKSSQLGFPKAQWLLASRYEEGDADFILPWKRKEKIQSLLKLSAEGGYPKAMVDYAATLYDQKDFEGFRSWNEKAAGLGYVDAILRCGGGLAGIPETYTFKEDLVRAYGLISTLSELDGGGGMQENVSYLIPKISAKMSSSDIQQGKEYAKNWKSSHPPLSFFRDKLGL